MDPRTKGGVSLVAHVARAVAWSVDGDPGHRGRRRGGVSIAGVPAWCGSVAGRSDAVSL